MRRGKGHRALYEAMSRSRSKPRRGSILERLRPQLAKLRMPTIRKPKLRLGRIKPVAEKPAPPVATPQVEPVRPPAEKPAVPVFKPPKPAERTSPSASPGPTQTWLRPKSFQFNAGRIEISIPWQLAVPIVLALILILLLVFRLGQFDQKARYGAAQTQRSGQSDEPAGSASREAATASSDVGSAIAGRDDGAAGVQGDHVIVLTQYARREDLEQVRAFFAQHGVETGIVTFERLREYFGEYGLNASRLPQGNGFMLMTMKQYNNPNDPGTDGYAARQEIKEIGAQYKAPAGSESFAAHYFSDAYGMKIR